MVASTVGIEYLFRAAGWLPARRGHGSVTAGGWGVDYTLWPTLAFLALTATLWYLRRLAQRRGAVEVTDTVCGVGFERREAEAARPTEHGTAYFCSTQCAHAFDQQPAHRAATG